MTAKKLPDQVEPLVPLSRRASVGENGRAACLLLLAVGLPAVGLAQATDYCSATSPLITECEEVAQTTACGSDGYVVQFADCSTPGALLDVLANTSLGESLRQAGASIVSVQPSGLALIRFPSGVRRELIDEASKLYYGQFSPAALADLRVKPLFSPNFIFNARQGGASSPVFTPASNWALTDIGVAQVASKGDPASPPLVLVIDDGVHCEHPDLGGRLWHNDVEFAALQADPVAAKGHDDDSNHFADDYHGIDASSLSCDKSGGTHVWLQDGYVGDECSTFVPPAQTAIRIAPHGSAVGGIIAADHSNGVGIDGVSAAAELVYCRAGTFDGAVSYFALAACLDYATSLKTADRRLVAVNFSYSAQVDPSCDVSPILERLADDFAALRQKGILFVAAAGDEDDDVDSSSFVYIPSQVRADNLLVVGRSGPGGALGSGSNHGDRSVHLLAPGNGIWITDPPDAILMTGDGTSWSTAFVSGAVAVVADFLLKSSAWPADRQWIAARNLLVAGGEKDTLNAAQTISDRRLRLAGTGGAGSTTCANQKVRTWLTRDQKTAAGSVALRAISINCADSMPESAGTKTLSAYSCAGGAKVAELKDDGVAPDTTADDGIFAFDLPVSSGQTLKICLPNDSNGTILTIEST